MHYGIKAEQQVRAKLDKLGYQVIGDIYNIARGTWAHTCMDVPCRWEAHAWDRNGKTVIIDGGASLSECARSAVELTEGGIAYGSLELRPIRRQRLSETPNGSS